MKRTRPILRWAGGKSRLLSHLLPRIPEHVCYVELFAGGAALLLAKERSKMEVLNDINGDLVSLYRNAQYHLPALLAEMEYTLAARANLKDFLTQPGLTELQRAARWYVRNRISFAGGMTTYAVSRSHFPSRENALENLQNFNKRLDRVSIENLSYERCMEVYDSKDTFFFIDPPYLEADTGTYQGWTEKDLRTLRKRVGKLRGQWLVTVDDSPLNRELFSDCRVEAITTRSGMVNQAKTSASFGELIIQPA